MIQIPWNGFLTQFAAGGMLFYGTQKFFKEVEEKLNENTKITLAVWLLDKHSTGRIQQLPDTFSRMLDKVFGPDHLSWTCIWRSSVASLITSALVWAWAIASGHSYAAVLVKNGLPLLLNRDHYVPVITYGPLILLAANIVPDYVSLLCTRYLLLFARRETSVARLLLIVLIDFAITAVIAVGPAYVGYTAVFSSADQSLRTIADKVAQETPVQFEAEYARITKLFADNFARIEQTDPGCNKFQALGKHRPL